MKALKLPVKFLPRGEGEWGQPMVRLSRPRRCMSHRWRTARKKVRNLGHGLEWDTYVRSVTSTEAPVLL